MKVTRLRPASRPVSPWQLRIELLDVAPRVWRRLLVPSSIKLPALHRVFQAALGWTNSHLHEFVINGVHYAEPDPEWNDELKQVNERDVMLSAALGRESRCFDYVYDFGDHWHHTVLVEDTFIRPQAEFSIQCIAGENACPPEDVGGPPGHANFLAAISDPRHEEHQNYMEWSAGHFDPARFDQTAVNRTLEKIGER
jgi:hypothetical protein